MWTAMIKCVASANQETVGNTYKVLCLEHFFERYRGLKAFQDDSAFGESLAMFKRCNSVHTYGMDRAIDIAFCDSDGCILASYQKVAPKNIKFVSRATCVFERFSCPGAWFCIDDRILVIKNPPQ